MMSSVIPARLTFQCGHAALVTLPRVKGESASQRNERVAFEKSAALLRQCDFCEPTVEVAAPMLLTEVIASHATTADVIAAEPVVQAEPEPELVVAVVTPPDLVETEPELEPEPVLEVIVSALEPEPTVALAPEEPKVNGHVNGVVKRMPTRRRQPNRKNFVVEYRAERVLKAANIHDALRVAAALGAADIVSITRER
jgi:hypothetical protein